MDTSGFSQVGRYGTISLMKRNEEHTVVASFGIDTEELTFGRETTCGVRLYYTDVALLHCKVVFEERKAFLVVLGESGVLVDGCKVFPRTSNNLSTIIPLANNSEFEIHGKRFRFSYPPKEIRAKLFATPSRLRNHALRLSMIHSAQVFSPQPSKDPRENLRILQSPLKNSFKSPVKATQEEEDQIILVQGSYPRVVQEERDLVILEDVALPPSPTKPQENFEPPQTPRRKSLGGNALHRAVLIRSAQRAVLKAEKEREEEEEEMEVLGAVVSANDDEEYEDDEREDIEMDSPNDDDDDYLDEAEQPERHNQKPMWRKSLEKIMWPFGGSEENAEDINEEDDAGRTADDLEDYEDNDVPKTPPTMDLYSTIETDEFEEDEDETEAPAPLPSRSSPQYTPNRRTLGSFMTPQAKSRPLLYANPAGAQPAIGRMSLGGGEARRVVVQQPWRIRDLIIPPLVATPSNPTRSPEKAVTSSTMTIQAPGSSRGTMALPEQIRTPMRTPVRPTLTEEERKAIQERRRSALKETGPFFPGGAPGLSPAKPKSLSGSSSPVKAQSSGSYNSPMKGYVIHEEDGEMRDKDIVQEDQEEEDTRSLLDRMKETVDGMRRRRSVALGITTPHAEGLGLPRSPFAPVTTPQRPLFRPEFGEVVDSTEDKNNEMREQEPFSLLRPGARDEVISRLAPTMLEVESPREGPIPLPVVVVDPIDEEDSPEVQDSPQIQEQPTRAKEGRSRLLRTSKTIDIAAGPSESNEEDKQNEANSKPRSRSTGPATRRSRSKTPQPPVPEEESAEIPRVTKSSTTAAGASAVAAAPSRRTRKATAEPEEQQPVAIPLPATGKLGRKVPVDVALEPPEQGVEESKRKVKAKASPVKRGKRAELSVEEEERHADSMDGDPTAEGSSEATTVPAAAPVKRGRPRKAAAQETLDHEESTLPLPVIAKTGTKKATKPNSGNTSRIRGTRTKPVVARVAVQTNAEDEDEDEDPLDSYNAIEGDDEDADLPDLPPPSRINTTKAKGRRKPTVEQDDEQSLSDPEEEAPLATAKSTTRASGTKSGGRAMPTARTPAVKSGGGRTRTKTPATAPASTTLVSNDKDKDKEKDKENTPRSAGSTGSGKLSPSTPGDGEGSGQTQAQGVPVKVRVSRRRGAPAVEERAEGTTGKTRTGAGSATATRSANKAAKVEVVEAAEVLVEEPVRVRRTRTRTKTG